MSESGEAYDAEAERLYFKGNDLVVGHLRESDLCPVCKERLIEWIESE